MTNCRVYLRALEPEDYKTTIRWRNDEEIWSMVGGPRYFVSSEYEKQWIQDAINNCKEIRVGISLKESDELIGLCSIIDINWVNKSAQSQIMIGEKQLWGRGYGTEAMLLLLQFAFKERGLERIWALILESNTGSIKIHEKCGCRKEGVLRHSVYKNGRYQNQVLMSILSCEFDEMVKERRFFSEESMLKGIFEKSEIL